MRPATLALKLLEALAGLCILVLGIGSLFTCAASFADYPGGDLPDAPDRWARGAYHVHTTRSDGRASPEEVAAAAKRAGLDFVVLTDHNDFVERPPRWEGGVLLIHGVEISTPRGHLVALGMTPPADGEALRQGDIAAARALGAATYLAHPVQRRNPWKDRLGARAATGLELYAADTLFREAMERPFTRLFPAIAGYLGHPVHGVMGLVREQPAATQLLLELSSDAGPPKVALCAHDAHGLPRYEDVFRSLALYVPRLDAGSKGPLPDAPRAAADHVLKSLAEGRAVCAFRALGEPAGFQWAGSAERAVELGTRMAVRLPAHPAGALDLRVFGAGRLTEDGMHVEALRPGPLHVEVWRLAPGRLWGQEWKPWIVPSPVRVVPRGAAF